MNICRHALTGVNTGVGIRDARQDQVSPATGADEPTEPFDPDFEAFAALVEAVIFDAADPAPLRTRTGYMDYELAALERARLGAMFGSVPCPDLVMPLRSHADWKRRFRRWRRAEMKQAHIARAPVAVIGRQRGVGRQQRNQRRPAASRGVGISDSSIEDPRRLRAKANQLSAMAEVAVGCSGSVELAAELRSLVRNLRDHARELEQEQSKLRRLTTWGGK